MSDDEELARNFQEAANRGEFDPFSLLTGRRRFHSCFLAPVSRSAREALDRFREHGDGPLAEIVAHWRSEQGMGTAEAATRLRELFEHAVGMLVLVFVDEQHLTTVPHLFFGHLSPEYRDGIVRTTGDDGPAVTAAINKLERRISGDTVGIEAYAGPSADPDPARYWRSLADAVLGFVDEGIIPGHRRRMGELAHWVARALDALPPGPDPAADLLRRARCRCLAGEVETAAEVAGELLLGQECEDELLAGLLDALVDAAIAERRPDLAATFFDRHRAGIDAVLGGIYEREIAEFRALVASQAGPDRLVVAAQALRRADKRSFRHDLNREPLWEIAIADPGPGLEVDEVAERLDRSVNFVSKRLDAGTIPWFRDEEGETRIPERGLAAWKAVVDEFGLLD